MLNILYSQRISGIFVSIYIASLVIFPLAVNIQFSNFINFLLIVYFIVYKTVNTAHLYSYNYFVRIYFLFFLLCFLSIFWSIDLDSSVQMALTVFLNSVNIFVLFNIIKTFNINNSIPYGLILGAIFNYLIALNIITFQNPFESAVVFVGTTAKSGSIAIVMLMNVFCSMLLYFNKKSKVEKYFHVLNILMALYVILLSTSKKGILIGGGLFAVFVILQIGKIRRTMTFLMIVPLLISTIAFFADTDVLSQRAERIEVRFSEMSAVLDEGVNTSGSTDERLYLIERGIEIFSEHPLLGTGIHTFRLNNELGLYSHNNFIELLVGVGLIGLSVYYFFFFSTFLRLTCVVDRNIRYIIFIFCCGILIMDNALISYNIKVILMIYLYISIYLDNIIKRENSEKDFFNSP